MNRIQKGSGQLRQNLAVSHDDIETKQKVLNSGNNKVEILNCHWRNVCHPVTTQILGKPRMPYLIFCNYVPPLDQLFC